MSIKTKNKKIVNNKTNNGVRNNLNLLKILKRELKVTLNTITHNIHNG